MNIQLDMQFPVCHTPCFSLPYNILEPIEKKKKKKCFSKLLINFS